MSLPPCVARSLGWPQLNSASINEHSQMKCGPCGPHRGGLGPQLVHPSFFLPACLPTPFLPLALRNIGKKKSTCNEFKRLPVFYSLNIPDTKSLCFIHFESWQNSLPQYQPSKIRNETPVWKYTEWGTSFRWKKFHHLHHLARHKRLCLLHATLNLTSTQSNNQSIAPHFGALLCRILRTIST